MTEKLHKKTDDTATKKAGRDRTLKSGLHRTWPTDDELVDAIFQAGGNITAVAKDLAVSRTWVYRHIEQSESLAQDVLAAREKTLDEVEGTLVQMATSGHDVAATIFYLKTQGRKRNYNERHQIDVTGTMESREKDASADAAYLAAVLAELGALSGASDVIDGEVIPPLLPGESSEGGTSLVENPADEADVQA